MTAGRRAPGTAGAGHLPFRGTLAAGRSSSVRGAWQLLGLTLLGPKGVAFKVALPAPEIRGTLRAFNCIQLLGVG